MACKIAVVGPGALGSLFSVMLSHAGHKVTLVDHREDRANRLSAQGIRLIDHGTGRETHAKPALALTIPTGQDFILVCTKSYSTASLRFPPETPLLTLQNGLTNVDILCQMVGSARVMAGTTSEGACLIEEGKVAHTGRGKTVFGAWTSCDCSTAYKALAEAGFHVELTEAPGQAIWEKVTVNAGINPLTALLNVPNGRLLEIREARELMRDLVVEAAKVAATEGYRFQHSLVELAEEVCRQTAANISSMLQDIRAGRQTEIDAISGEILRRAQVAGLPTPRTRVIWQLVTALEKR
jgi:2-dehydropantoate 2-reductase